MWALAGLFLALGGAAFAGVRSRSHGGFYEAEVYAMSATSHRRFVIVSLAFAGVFALLGAVPVVPLVPFLAAYVLFLILYVSSFARGATSEAEAEDE